ncbi:MAG TPA: hypothetical protein VF057_14285 [Thermoanaerobaculia bacterium]
MEEFDSTLVKRGRKASTFADMVAFAQSVHERPFERLLEELPQLARLSDTKFNLATRVLRRRFEAESEATQMQLREFGEKVASLSTPWVATRIRAIFEYRRG